MACHPVVPVLAGVFFLFMLLPSLSPHYGFYSDELYYLACADRLAFGYVDHPPLFVFLLRAHRALLGDSLFALRALPAAAGALTVFLTGRMAWRLGGGAYAQGLAALAAMVTGTSLVMFGIFTVNCLEVLLWTTACAVLLELCRTRDSRLWLALGTLLGLSLLTKHTTSTLIAGVVVATLMSPLRGDLRGPWPWLGALAAGLIVAPNFLWQAANGWPSLDFYRSVAASNIRTSVLEGLARQIVAQNPATFPLWAAGVFFFLRSPRGLAFRPLGWVFLTVLAVMLIGGQSRPDRIAGVYPMAFAGGAVVLGAARRAAAGPLRRIWDTWALPSLMLAIGLLASTLTLPILPPAVLAQHPLYDGDDWRREPGPKRLPYLLGNRTHWRQLVARVEEVAQGLETSERDGAIVLADYFGHAGALEYYGDPAELPPVYSPHTGYYLWGPPRQPPDTLISIGVDEALLRAHFASVSVAATFRCTWCPPWQDGIPIRLARTPRRPFAELWRELGRIGGMDRHRRLLAAEGVRRAE